MNKMQSILKYEAYIVWKLSDFRVLMAGLTCCDNQKKFRFLGIKRIKGINTAFFQLYAISFLFLHYFQWILKRKEEFTVYWHQTSAKETALT